MKAVDVAGAAGVSMLGVGLWQFSPALMLCVCGLSLIATSIRFNTTKSGARK